MRRIAFLLAAAACGSGGTWKRGDAPVGVGEARLTRVEYRPAAEPTRRYNDPPRTPPPRTQVVDVLLGQVARSAEANGRAAPAGDGRLCAVAEEVARLSTEGPPPYAAVEFALAQHGIIEPSPHLLVVRASGDDAAGVAHEMAGRLPAILTVSRFTRAGAGAAEGRDGAWTYVLALQESFVETDPIARRAPSGGTITLRGRLLHPFGDPALFVTGADGAVTRLKLAREGTNGFRADVPCTDEGRMQVEIVGHDRSGASVLANFPIWCGMDPPRSLTVVVSADDARVDDPGVVERRLLDLANADRKKAGLPPLEWHERAAQIARAHSQEMRDLGYVSHVSPTTGSAADRVQRARLVTPLVLENLARAYSAAEAHAGLMNSPGHRANLLSSEATHVGVGVRLGREVAGRPELYVTQLFVRIPPPIDPRATREAVRKAIQDARAAAGRKALDPDGELDKIAQEYAEALASGGDKEAAARKADKALDAFAGRYSAVVTIASVIGEPKDAVIDTTLEAPMKGIGLGVAQAKETASGQGAVYVVLLVGRRR